MASTMYGVDAGTYYVIGGTQAEKDANCAKLCDETSNCESWVSLVSSAPTAPCYLKGGAIPQGLINAGILGINGRTIGNSAGRVVLKKILDLVMHLLCKKSHAQVVPHVTGEGTIRLDVPESFAMAEYFNYPSQWTAEDLRVTSAQFEIKASDPKMQPLVDDVVHFIRDTVAGSIAAIGSFVGSVVDEEIKECERHPLLCGSLDERGMIV